MQIDDRVAWTATMAVDPKFAAEHNSDKLGLVKDSMMTYEESVEVLNVVAQEPPSEDDRRQWQRMKAPEAVDALKLALGQVQLHKRNGEGLRDITSICVDLEDALDSMGFRLIKKMWEV